MWQKMWGLIKSICCPSTAIWASLYPVWSGFKYFLRLVSKQSCTISNVHWDVALGKNSTKCSKPRRVVEPMEKQHKIMSSVKKRNYFCLRHSLTVLSSSRKTAPLELFPVHCWTRLLGFLIVIPVLPVAFSPSLCLYLSSGCLFCSGLLHYYWSFW